MTFQRLFTMILKSNKKNSYRLERIEYDETVEKTVKFVNSEREYLLNELERLGIKYFQPKANYIFFKADEGLKEKLAEKRILIRCCGNYRSLDGRYYRVAVKKHEENMKLIFALEEYVWQRQ